jgi:hypothetical protein
MLEIFLEMNESTRSLDEALKKIVVPIGIEPKLFEHIVGFVIMLLVPALKKCAIKWMLGDAGLFWIDRLNIQLRHESGNPLAFVHEGLNLVVPQMMGKLAGSTFPEGPESSPRDESVGMADFRDGSEK